MIRNTSFSTVRLGAVLMCPHATPCPSAYAVDREAARVVASHPEQGWSLLCNGVIQFEDTGELLPDLQVIPPHRPTDVVGLHPQDVSAA